MSEMRQKLQELLANQGVMLGQEWRKQREEEAAQRAAGGFEITHVVPGEVVGDEDFGFYRTTQDCSLEETHGTGPLGGILHTNPAHLALAACDPSMSAFDPHKAVFIDTETTGLSGGTGTVAFLIGAGYLIDGAFRVEQCFMRDFDDEEPMLEYLGTLLRPFDTVVTYNGKTFDVPLMRTRFVQNRMRFPLDHAVHFDLLHAARRIWRDRLRDCSLGNIERKVLSVNRHGDVPSAEIPQIWLDYVRSRDARQLERVFYHHRMDILSLVSLTAHVSQNVDLAAHNTLDHREDQLAVMRLHFRQGRYAEVDAHGKRFLEECPSSDLKRECLTLMAFSHKKSQDWHGMREACLHILTEFPTDMGARLELAKLYEHRIKDLLEAIRLCEETLEILSGGVGLPLIEADVGELEASFRHRLARLQRRTKRQH